MSVTANPSVRQRTGKHLTVGWHTDSAPCQRHSERAAKPHGTG